MVDEKSAKIFEELRIRDSKKITDGRILKLEPIIKENAPYSVIAISNGKYNELYGNMKNLNKLLAWGHARTIENILEKMSVVMQYQTSLATTILYRMP